MEFLTLINWTSPFQLKVVIIAVQILIEHSLLSVAPSLGLYLFPMTNKRKQGLYGSKACHNEGIMSCLL